jgi:hypothetical protein
MVKSSLMHPSYRLALTGDRTFKVLITRYDKASQVMTFSTRGAD